MNVCSPRRCENPALGSRQELEEVHLGPIAHPGQERYSVQKFAHLLRPASNKCFQPHNVVARVGSAALPPFGSSSEWPGVSTCYQLSIAIEFLYAPSSRGRYSSNDRGLAKHSPPVAETSMAESEDAAPRLAAVLRRCRFILDQLFNGGRRR